MDIFHVDPGYGRGLTVSNGSVSCVESDEYNPINGVAFTCLASDSTAASVNLALPAGFPSSLSNNAAHWIGLRFSAYLDIQSSNRFVCGFGARSRIVFSTNSAIAYTALNPNASAITSQELTNSLTSGFHNIALSIYVKRVEQNYYIYLYADVDGYTWHENATKTYSNPLYGIDYVFSSGIRFTFPTSSTDICYISNIIAAHQTSTYENLTSEMLLAKLPLSTPLTTSDFLSAGDGEYVGTTSGQKLLSAINAGENSDVITKFGATSKVSHIITYGNPGYRVGSNVTSATGISQSGNDSITAHGNCSLSADADAAACVAWEADAGTKLSDLDGLKVGWQV